MKRSLLRAALFVGAFTALDDAAAIEIAIDDTRIELAAPAGYCPLDRKGWPGSQLIDFTSTGSRNRASGWPILSIVSGSDLGPRAPAAKTLGTLSTIRRHCSSETKMSRAQCWKSWCATLRKGDDSS